MEEQRAASSTKRQRKHDKNDESQQRKSQRLSSPVNEMYTTQITDLNEKCLMKIFNHLDLKGLFNVAISNAYFRPAAGEMYKRKFGNMQVDIVGCGKVQPNTRAEVTPIFNDIKKLIIVHGLKAGLMYLRYFGPYITNLVIDYDSKSKSMSKRFEYVHQYINDYCAESLVRFAFYYMPKNASVERFQKNFTNVKEVRIFGNCSVLSNRSFVKWFPALRELILMDVLDYGAVAKPIQQLEYLFIKRPHSNGDATAKMVADLLNGTHQLKIVMIVHDRAQPLLTSFDMWLDVIKKQPSLAEFGIEDCVRIKTTQVQQLVGSNSKLIDLYLPNCRLKVDDAVELVQKLSSLKKFTFQMPDLDYHRLLAQLNGAQWKVSHDYVDTYNRYTRAYLTRKM